MLPSSISSPVFFDLITRRQRLSGALLVLGLSAGALTSACTHARVASSEPQTLQATGEAEVARAPTEASITLAVVTESKEAAVAVAENARAHETVLDAVNGQIGSAGSIESTGFQLNAVYDYGAGERVFQGYRVSHNLEIRLWDLTKVGRVLDAAVAAGIEEVHGVQFGLRDAKEAQEEAIREATKVARARAEAAAMASGVRLKEPARIVVLHQGAQGPDPLPGVRMMEARKSTEVSPGAVTVRAAVTASYGFEPQR